MTKEFDVKFGGCDFFFEMIFIFGWNDEKNVVVNVFTLFLENTFRFHQVDKCLTLNQHFNTIFNVYIE